MIYALLEPEAGSGAVRLPDGYGLMARNSGSGVLK